MAKHGSPLVGSMANPFVGRQEGPSIFSDHCQPLFVRRASPEVIKVSFDLKLKKLLRFEVECLRPPCFPEEAEEMLDIGRKGHTEEEILRILREAESGETVVEVCRKHGVSQQSFHLWKKKYAGLGLSELRELRQ